MPKVVFFNIENGVDIKNNLIVGQKILNSNSVSCKRNPDKDLLLTLQTTRGSITYKVPAENTISTSKEMPIGTIICSYLNFEQFNAASKNNEKSLDGIWTSSKSKWAPCDGRPVPESNFTKVASQTNVPDLRGLYLRGVNNTDPYYTIQPTNPTQLNPDNTSVGVYQPDEIKSHNHTVTAAQNTSPGGLAPGGSGSSLNGNYNIISTSTGGNETRPKSISIYYYIKIN